MEHTKHIWRMGLLVFFLLAGFIFVRQLLVPATFGAYGAYRGANVADQMVIRPPQHGEVAGCYECHDDEVDTHQAGSHKTVSCENCHAPMATHVDAEGEQYAEMNINQTGEWCIRCHLKLPARPKSQPQLDPVEHLLANGVEQVGRDWSDQVCFECHAPHDPAVEEPAQPVALPAEAQEGEQDAG